MLNIRIVSFVNFFGFLVVWMLSPGPESQLLPSALKPWSLSEASLSASLSFKPKNGKQFCLNDRDAIFKIQYSSVHAN